MEAIAAQYQAVWGMLSVTASIFDVFKNFPFDVDSERPV